MPVSSSHASSVTGSIDAALEHAGRLLREAPELALEQLDECDRVSGPHPRSAWLRAHAEIALGRSESARRTLADLARTQPRLPAIWLLLGDLHRAAGDLPASHAAFARHIEHAIHDPQLAQAASALHDNALSQAEPLLRARLREHPTDVAAIRMLAELAVRIGRHEDAERLLERCLELAPGFAAARMNYALVLHRSNQPEKALHEIDALLAANPDDPSSLNLRAVVLCRTGDYAQGIAIYQRLLHDHPREARIWLSYGHALKTEGQTDEAISAYQRCLALDPNSGEAWWSLANLKTHRFRPKDISAMQAIDPATQDVEQRSQLQFALGKAMEDAGAYAESFQHYQQGNALRQQLMPYRAEEASARVERSRALFSRTFLAERSGWGCDAADPIFIVGMPRAGSTLVEQILSSHPAVEGTMELPEIISITRELRQSGRQQSLDSYHEVLDTLDAEAFREMGERYLQRTRIQRKQGRPLFIDKMPNNFFHVGLIHLILPNAKIIDVRRHPMACCFSGFKQYFARGQNFSYGLSDIGAYYRDYVQLMSHVDQVLPGRVHRVIYEQLVDDIETEVRQLLDYCGLPFADECLRFFENDRAVRTASSEQVRQPVYRDGIDHWRHYEAWLGPLRQALGPVLDSYPEPPALADWVG